MIPDIGIMIGAYIITRMTSILARRGERSEDLVIKIFAGLTILVTTIGLIDLWMQSTR